MPNIEIHGMDQWRAAEVKRKIFKVLAALGDSLVVETYLTTVDDRKGDDQPYFRICFTAEDNSELILQEMKKFDVDIEYLQLGGFIPRYSWNENPDDRLERPARPRYEET